MGLSKLFYIVILPLTLWIFRRYVYLVYAVRDPSLLPPSLIWRLCTEGRHGVLLAAASIG